MKNDIKALISAAIFLTLMFSVLSLDLRPAFEGGSPRVVTFPGMETGPRPQEDPASIGQFMFGDFALPLIVLSMALLVALIGALFLAKPDRPGEGGP